MNDYDFDLVAHTCSSQEILKIFNEQTVEIERLKTDVLKYQQSNKDHWDHLANTAKDLRYDNQVREGHLDVIRDTAKERDNLKTEIERLKEENSALENSLVEQDFEIERLKGIIRRMLQYEFYCGFLGYVERSAGGGET